MPDQQNATGAKRTKCPDEVMRAIYGTTENKKEAYDASLQRWWKEYSARKNDEEEEHVADSLLYDERCHLPRTVERPDCAEPYQERSS
ncbi:hypothetical protein BSKO_06369 [Bryopsis sp. KO-2023]|nr:hypothetical protein BSKO_06369 [Bryopsis sp. KO-2023]